MLTLLLKGVKETTNFLIEDFLNLPTVSTTLVVHIKLRISLRIFEKFWNGPYGILWGWGKTIHEKPEV